MIMQISPSNRLRWFYAEHFHTNMQVTRLAPSPSPWITSYTMISILEWGQLLPTAAKNDVFLPQYSFKDWELHI